MQLPESEKPDIRYLSRLFDNKNECYKLFWFEAVVNKVLEDKAVLTYDELINEMIASAWYMVSEYKLNLGPSDTLEALVLYAYNDGKNGLKSSEKKENIIAFLETCRDKKVTEKKRTLTYNVPYRLQAPFLEKVKGKEWDVAAKALAEKINREKHLIYYFIAISGINSRIQVQQDWIGYIKRNREIIRGWIEYNKIIYLQRRNPSVPGIAYKLYPEQRRDLDRVKKYWKMVLSVRTMHDIYDTGEILEQSISIDHFVPWSYVAHDELWNLIPTTKNINSKKNSNLPNWDRYFPALCNMEYMAYEMVWTYDKVHDAFVKCLDNNVNSDDVKRRLYAPGLEKNVFCKGLEDILLPVHQAARRQGFREWELAEPYVR